MDSRTIHASLICSQCQRSFEAEIPVRVNARKNPEWIAAAQQGTLHLVQCPYCRTLVPVDVPLLLFIPERRPPLVFIPSRRASFRDALDQLESLLTSPEGRREPSQEWEEEPFREVEIVPSGGLSEALEGRPAAASRRPEELPALKELEDLLRTLFEQENPLDLFETCRRIREAGWLEAARLVLAQLQHRLTYSLWQEDFADPLLISAIWMVTDRISLFAEINEHAFLSSWLRQSILFWWPFPPFVVALTPQELEQWEPEPWQALRRINEAYQLHQSRFREAWRELWEGLPPEEWMWRWPPEEWVWVWRRVWWERERWAQKIRRILPLGEMTPNLAMSLFMRFYFDRLIAHGRWFLTERLKEIVGNLGKQVFQDTIETRFYLIASANVIPGGPVLPLGLCMVCPESDCGYAWRRAFKGQILICPTHSTTLQPDPNRTEC
jgi:hypothetical protein